MNPFAPAIAAPKAAKLAKIHQEAKVRAYPGRVLLVAAGMGDWATFGADALTAGRVLGYLAGTIDDGEKPVRFCVIPKADFLEACRMLLSGGHQIAILTPPGAETDTERDDEHPPDDCGL